ncbi:hypothetical protein KDJ57_gp68 [Gordonia phage Catfish]|uniref:Uncharacterized protein n=1 Tax=Gordonia phage Catfish TaxID=2301538 RepID=A0A385D2F3_9CAUD|nr:hypothetical protein KDJ57_gp68 [Gordonia phage Catfish]AXQ51877.1 hypothetical protein SEA_CATFISH_41 [Gordonia phage Catfish]
MNRHSDESESDRPVRKASVPTSEFLEEYRVLADEGLTHPEIAARLEIETEYLMTRLRRAGVTPDFRGIEGEAWRRLERISRRPGAELTAFDLPFGLERRGRHSILTAAVGAGLIEPTDRRKRVTSGTVDRVYVVPAAATVRAA